MKPPLRLARRLAVWLVITWIGRSRGRPRPPGSPTKLVFFINTAYGMGGTINTVLNLAGHLAEDYDVEVVSVVRTRQQPFFAFPAGVQVRVLHDHTETPRRARKVRDALAGLPSLLINEEDGAYESASLWTDVQMLRMFRALPPSILIPTRPGLNLIAARLAPERVTTVAQEHVSYRIHRPGVRRAVARTYWRLDALAVLTEHDRQHYGRLLAGTNTRIVRIPNALPASEFTHAGRREKIVISAGRLAPQKRFHRLIDAFARVVAKHPDWQLRIYGAGKLHEQLRQQILAAHLYNHVFLMGRTNRLEEELAKASVFALPSRHEGFGLVIIEAMSAGLPAVSFDSGGPAEIITHEHDGLIVADQDEDEVGPLAEALLALIDDEPARARMSKAAHATAKQFDIDTVGQQWRELFAELGARPRSTHE